VHVCNHCNICNIHMKHLRRTSETSKTLETDACNMRFQAQHLLAAWTKIEARRRGARCYGMVRRSLVWKSSAARTSAGGQGRQMERGHNKKREYGLEQHGEGEIRPASKGAQHTDTAERAGDADGGGASGRHGRGLFYRRDHRTRAFTIYFIMYP
jgi:hypothetical protein